MRPKLGDILEISVEGGYGYLQYTHQHERYGGLVRAFDLVSSNRLASIESLRFVPIRFSTFFPVRAAKKEGIVTVVGSLPIRESLQDFPIFQARAPGEGPWWLWDGETEWEVGELTKKEMCYPTRGVVNDTLLREMISSGYTDGGT